MCVGIYPNGSVASYSAPGSLHISDMQAMLAEVITFEQTQTGMQTVLCWFSVFFFRRSAHQIFWILLIKRVPNALLALFWSKRISHSVQRPTLYSQEAWDTWVLSDILDTRCVVVAMTSTWIVRRHEGRVVFWDKLEHNMERRGDVLFSLRAGKSLAVLWWWFSFLHPIVNVFIHTESN